MSKNAADEARDREEREWVTRCLAGETRWFRPLLERYERMVRGVVRRLADADHEVDELAQQTFVTAYENLAQYSGKAKFSTWLCQIALNKCRDRLRRRRPQDDVTEMDVECADAGPEQQAEIRQRDRLLQAALRKLKDSDRELVVLKYITGHDYETVATVVGCSVEAAKVRSVRARESLKRILLEMGVSL